MERLMDDEDLAQTVVAGFLDDMPKQIRAFKSFIEHSDSEQASARAHKIQGAAVNMGGEALREVAFEIEKAGEAGDLSLISARMADLEKEFGRLQEAMEKKL